MKTLKGSWGEVKMFLVILTGAVLVVISTGIHLAALSGISKLMPRWSAPAHIRIAVFVLVAMLAHILEIVLFAGGLISLVALGGRGHLNGLPGYGFADYIYYSTVTYTTLGFGDITPSGPLRLFTGMESLTGLLLIAWTASLLFLIMQRHWTQDKM